MKKINLPLLIGLNVTAIFSIKNIPILAEYGFASISFIGLALLLFFIPTALVSAELSSKLPDSNGIFTWVNNALGKSCGFVAISMLWLQNIIWYPTILAFVITAFSYVLGESMITNPLHQYICTMVIFWSMLLANLYGLQITGWVTTILLIIGTIVPSAIIIICSSVWFYSSTTLSRLNFQDFLPTFNFASLAYLTGVFLNFCGMEVSAIHLKDTKNPQTNYPLSVLFSGIIILVLSCLCTMGIVLVIPKQEINLLSGSMDTIKIFLKEFHLNAFVPYILMFIGLGALGSVNSWMVGPAKGIALAMKHLRFPTFLCRNNKYNVPYNMIILQGIIISILYLIFIFTPSVNTAFWFLIVMSSQCYLCIYILMFISAIVLRYKMKNSYKGYKIPFGNIGIWTIALLGTFSSIFAIITGFIPPNDCEFNETFFSISLMLSIVLSIVIPIVVCNKYTDAK